MVEVLDKVLGLCSFSADCASENIDVLGDNTLLLFKSLKLIIPLFKLELKHLLLHFLLSGLDAVEILEYLLRLAVITYAEYEVNIEVFLVLRSTFGDLFFYKYSYQSLLV